MKETDTTKFLVALAVIASSAASEVQAVDTSKDTVATDLREIEVRASRRTNDLKTASPAFSLQASQLNTKGITDISDALRRLPGVNLRDYGGSGGMKTVSVRGLGAQHTSVLYDGIALSEIRGGQIDLSRYSLDNIGAITLHAGDNDDIYLPARAISSATSLSVTTLRNPDMLSNRPELTVRMRYASFMTLNPYVRLALSNGENLGMSLTGEYTHARNDYKFRLRNGNTVTTERRQNSQLNLGHAEWNGIWKPYAAGTLQAKLYWFENSRHLPGPVIYYNNVSHERLRERNMFGQLSFTGRLSNSFSLRAAFKYNWSATRYTDKDGRYPGGMLDRRYFQQEEYGTATLLYRPLSSLSLSYAIDYWHNALRTNLPTDGHPLRNTLLQAVAVKWNVWRLTAFARGLVSLVHDKSTLAPEGKTEKRFSPSAGFTIQPVADEQFRIRASYKGIFRMPTFDELYFDHYGSVNLRPETADQFNLGFTWTRAICSWLPSLELTADGYLNMVRNKIVAVPYNMFVMTMTNLGRVRILGIDATLNADFRLAEGHDLLLGGNYSYQRAAPRTDRNMSDWMKQVAYTPLNSGAWSLAWTNPWVNVSVHGSGCSARYTTNSNLESTRLAGYMEAGLALFRELKFRNYSIDLRADIINAFNKQFEIIGRYPMPGRSFSFSVTFNLK